MAAYIVFESGHTFGAPKSSPCIFKGNVSIHAKNQGPNFENLLSLNLIFDLRLIPYSYS